MDVMAACFDLEDQLKSSDDADSSSEAVRTHLQKVEELQYKVLDFPPSESSHKSNCTKMKKTYCYTPGVCISRASGDSGTCGFSLSLYTNMTMVFLIFTLLVFSATT